MVQMNIKDMSDVTKVRIRLHQIKLSFDKLITQNRHH